MSSVSWGKGKAGGRALAGDDVDVTADDKVRKLERLA